MNKNPRARSVDTTRRENTKKLSVPLSCVVHEGERNAFCGKILRYCIASESVFPQYSSYFRTKSFQDWEALRQTEKKKWERVTPSWWKKWNRAFFHSVSSGSETWWKFSDKRKSIKLQPSREQARCGWVWSWKICCVLWKREKIEEKLKTFFCVCQIRHNFFFVDFTSSLRVRLRPSVEPELRKEKNVGKTVRKEYTNGLVRLLDWTRKVFRMRRDDRRDKRIFKEFLELIYVSFSQSWKIGKARKDSSDCFHSKLKKRSKSSARLFSTDENVCGLKIGQRGKENFHRILLSFENVSFSTWTRHTLRLHSIFSHSLLSSVLAAAEFDEKFMKCESEAAARIHTRDWSVALVAPFFISFYDSRTSQTSTLCCCDVIPRSLFVPLIYRQWGLFHSLALAQLNLICVRGGKIGKIEFWFDSTMFLTSRRVGGGECGRSSRCFS